MNEYFPEPPDHRDIWRLVGWIGAFALVGLAFLLFSFTVNWGAAALDQGSPARLRQLSREANDRYTALKSERATIETQRARLADFEQLYGKDPAAWPQGKREEYQQLTQAIRNMESAYNGHCGQYKSLWNDAWRDLPAPDDLPKTCDLI
jgi:hypothetical protein